MTDTSCHAAEVSRRMPDNRLPMGPLARLRAWWRARQALRAMLWLDDRSLRDIGLTRQALARHYRRRNFWW